MRLDLLAETGACELAGFGQDVRGQFLFRIRAVRLCVNLQPRQ